MAMERLRAKMAADSYDSTVLQPASTSSTGRVKSSAPRPAARFGSIPGIPVGAQWASRDECHKAGMHIKNVAGISGTAKLGAYSVVLSGGYEDDDDEGDHFIYTGTGGRAPGESYRGNAEQSQDQDWDHPDNQALMTSYKTGKPVRVVRGANAHSPWAPVSGYRYDGLYKIRTAYEERGKSGFLVCKVEFQRLSGQPPIPKLWA